MEDINEFLQGLEEDGKFYAHFFTHPDHPGYYGIWVRERTPEYVQNWLPYGPLLEYSLAFSIEMADTAFRDYMLELYPDHTDVYFLRELCKIDDVSNPQQWAEGFKTWKQEKTLKNRTKMLDNYPWGVSLEKKPMR